MSHRRYFRQNANNHQPNQGVRDQNHAPNQNVPNDAQGNPPPMYNYRAQFVNYVSDLIHYASMYQTLSKIAVLFVLSLMSLFLTFYCKCYEIEVRSYDCIESFLTSPTFICSLLAYTPLPLYLSGISRYLSKNTLNMFVVFGAVSDLCILVLFPAGIMIFLYKFVLWLYYIYFTPIHVKLQMAKERTKELESGIADLKNQLVEVNKDKLLFERQLGSSYLNASELRGHIQRLDSDHQNSRNLLQRLQSQNEMITVQLMDKNQEAMELSEKLKVKEAKLVEADSKIKYLQEKVNKAEQSKAKLKNQLAEVNKNYHAMKRSRSKSQHKKQH